MARLPEEGRGAKSPFYSMCVRKITTSAKLAESHNSLRWLVAFFVKPHPNQRGGMANASDLPAQPFQSRAVLVEVASSCGYPSQEVGRLANPGAGKCPGLARATERHGAKLRMDGRLLLFVGPVEGVVVVVHRHIDIDNISRKDVIARRQQQLGIVK